MQLNKRKERIEISGESGPIDLELIVPNEVPHSKGLAIVAHPHPLHGGSRDNKVVQTLARVLLAFDYTVALPNFRGVGSSAGSFDNGKGETTDLLFLAETLLQQNTIKNSQNHLILAGFSFGAAVQACVVQKLIKKDIHPSMLILVGTAVSRFTVPFVPEGTLIIHGELDEVIPLSSLLEWARPQENPVVIVPGACHFFHKKLTFLKKIVNDALCRTQSNSQSTKTQMVL